VARIGELGTTLAVTRNRNTLERNIHWIRLLNICYVEDQISKLLYHTRERERHYITVQCLPFLISKYSSYHGFLICARYIYFRSAIMRVWQSPNAGSYLPIRYIPYSLWSQLRQLPQGWLSALRFCWPRAIVLRKEQQPTLYRCCL
jgi:hypothetical protein